MSCCVWHPGSNICAEKAQRNEGDAGAVNTCFSTHLFTSTLGPFTLSVCWLSWAYQLKTRLISSVASSTQVKCHVLNRLFWLLGIWTFSLPFYSRKRKLGYLFPLSSCEMLGITAERLATHAMVTRGQAPQKSLHLSLPVQIAEDSQLRKAMGKINLK